MIAEQDPSECTAHVSWASDQVVPTWLDQCRELSEYWIHRQQLRQAVGMATDLRTDVAGPVLDGLKWAYPHRLSFLDVPIGTTALIEVAGDDLDSSWHLTLGANGWRFSDMAAVNPSAHLSLTTEQAWRLLTNNLPVDQQMQLSAVGQFQIVEALRQTRAIIGAPK